MQIIINIEKKHFVFLTVLVAVLFVFGVSASTYKNPVNKVGHDANETGPGTFGGNGDYKFPSNLNISNNLYVNGSGGIRENLTVNRKITTVNISAYIINSTHLFANSIIVVPGPSNGIQLGGVHRTTWPTEVSWTADCTTKSWDVLDGSVWGPSCPAGKVVVQVKTSSNEQF